MVIYSYGRLQVVRENNAFKIQDANNYEDHHTHSIKSLKMCKTICHNVVDHRKPFTRNGYILESHRRLSNNKKYTKMIEQLIRNKDKQKHYHDKHVYISCR